MRLFLGVLILSTGIMKLAVPMLAEAWAGQLAQAEIPLRDLSLRIVPAVEIFIGGYLIAGFFSRIASLLLIGIMTVATYVHLVVVDPSVFPLQPSQPVVPLVIIGLASYVLWGGSGAWSLDRASMSAGDG